MYDHMHILSFSDRFCRIDGTLQNVRKVHISKAARQVQPLGTLLGAHGGWQQSSGWLNMVAT
jgi:hypothetical protein